MAQPADTFSTYDAIGNREDLSDIIYDISPTETPFMSGIARVPATATLHEWQTDALDTASASNAVIEGDDATTTAATPSVRLGNRAQISDKVPRVTGTQRVVDSAGRGDEFDYQILKSSKALKRDMESALLANNAAVVGNDTTARELGGIEAWIATNDDFGSGGASGSLGTTARTDGTQRAFAESDLKSVLASCFDAGGDPNMIMVGSFNKQAMSAFSGNATRNTNSSDQTLNTAIKIYVSDFGELQVQTNRFQRSRSALVLDMDMWAMATLREFDQTPLAKTGDSDRVQIISEYTLESRNEAASGGVFDLTTS